MNVFTPYCTLDSAGEREGSEECWCPGLEFTGPAGPPSLAFIKVLQIMLALSTLGTMDLRVTGCLTRGTGGKEKKKQK